MAVPVHNSRPQPRRSQRAPAVLAGLKGQAHRCEATRNIETGAAFDADWLKRNRIAGAANQHIGTDADPDRGACGDTSVSAGKRNMNQVTRSFDFPATLSATVA